MRVVPCGNVRPIFSHGNILRLSWPIGNCHPREKALPHSLNRVSIVKACSVNRWEACWRDVAPVRRLSHPIVFKANLVLAFSTGLLVPFEESSSRPLQLSVPILVPFFVVVLLFLPFSSELVHWALGLGVGRRAAVVISVIFTKRSAASIALRPFGRAFNHHTAIPRLAHLLMSLEALPAVRLATDPMLSLRR